MEAFFSLVAVVSCAAAAATTAAEESLRQGAIPKKSLSQTKCTGGEGRCVERTHEEQRAQETERVELVCPVHVDICACVT